MTEFKIGDKVAWTSQAGGRYTEKQGVVYGVIRDTPGLYNAKWDLKEADTHSLMFDGNTMLAPVMYLVEVKGGPKARPKMYLPRPKQLKLVEGK